MRLRYDTRDNVGQSVCWLERQRQCRQTSTRERRWLRHVETWKRSSGTYHFRLAQLLAYCSLRNFLQLFKHAGNHSFSKTLWWLASLTVVSGSCFFLSFFLSYFVQSVLWYCWLDDRKVSPASKKYLVKYLQWFYFGNLEWSPVRYLWKSYSTCTKHCTL